MDRKSFASSSRGFINAPRDEAATDAQTNKITAPMLHNATRSTLVRLPDKILLLIMSHTDDVGILCLRGTCRTMLRLTSDPRFRRLHDTNPGGPDPEGPKSKSYSFPVAKAPKEAENQLRRLLQKDMYCELCRAVKSEDAERRLREESLYCSGCKRSHPAGLFSFHQRRRESDRSRICIGREGYLRACQHLTIPWAQVDTYLSARPTPVDLNITFSCDDPSHECSWPLAGHSRKDPKRHVTVSFCVAGDGQRGQRRPSREPGNCVLTISWNTHMAFPGLGRNGGMELADVSERIEWARRNGGSCIFQDQPGKLPAEMRTFDPNLCSCVRLPSEPPGVSWNWGARGKDWQSSSHCNQHYARCPSKPVMGANSYKHREEFDFWANRACLLNRVREGLSIDNCSELAYCLSFTYTKTIPLGPTKYLNCKGVVDAETGKWTERIQPWWGVWFMALDPESISLRDDEDSKGVYWCDTKTCLNYHANHRHNRKRWALDPTHDGLECRSGPEKKNDKMGLMSKLKFGGGSLRYIFTHRREVEYYLFDFKNISSPTRDIEFVYNM